MTKFRILICARTMLNLDGPHWDLLNHPDFELVRTGADRVKTEDEVIQLISGIDGMIIGLEKITPRVLDAADRLRVVAMNGVGVSHIDIPACTAHRVAVANTPGGNADSVADFTLALILALARKLFLHDARVRSGNWTRDPGFELRGKLLGIIGLGNIGKGVALRAAAFGMKVQVAAPRVDQDFCKQLGIAVVDMNTLLATSDVVSLHCPYIPGTGKLINRETLAKMKDGAYLINTARGELIDEDALVEALKSGKLAGAGLDVFTVEPPAHGPLMEMDQVVLAPHLGGVTQEALRRTAYQSAVNVRGVLLGEPGATILNAAELGL